MSSPSPDPLIGREIDGRYQVRARVARGGMATVYRALDKRLDREVALKVMHPYLSDGAAGAQFLARFRREARAAARLTHPGLVAVFDQGVDGDVTYLTMEFISGQDLRRYLTQRGTLPLDEALDITRQILRALAVAHRAQMVHRDIKPENVMLTATGQVKVADFGLARAVTEVTATSTGTVLGTVAYLGPEVITTGLADARTDLYAVGVVLYEMLLGTQPHTGETPIQVAYQHVHSDIPRVRETLDALPVAIDEFVATLAARERDARPADADAALALLDSALAQLPAGAGRVRHNIAAAPAWDALVTTSEITGDAGATTALSAVRPGTTAQFPLDRLDTVPAGVRTPGALAATATSATSSADSAATSATDSATTSATTTPAASSPTSARAARRAAKQKAKDRPAGGAGTSSQRPARAAFAKRRRLIVAALLVVALAGIGTYIGWYQLAGPGAYLTIPTGITGVTSQAAQDRLTTAGIGVKVNEKNDDNIPAGQVISATPDAGALIKKNESVLLVVSLGPVMYAIPPGLIGQQVAEATAALKANKITVTEPTTSYFDDVPTGQVTALSSGDATQIRHDKPITLTISGGPAPVTIADLADMTAEQAKTALTELGLKFAQAPDQYSDTVPSGKVISQDPPARADGHRTDTVTVTISKGRAPVTVPDNYFGQKIDRVTAALEALGFKVAVTKPYAVTPFNQVLKQSAKKGDVLPYGSTITLEVF